MRQYLARRLLLMVPTAILATMIVFLLMKLVPGDAAMAIMYSDDSESIAGVGGGGGVTQGDSDARLEELRERFGLSDPLPVQYWNWMVSVGKGNFGESTWQFRPVRDIILERLPRSAWLGVLIVGVTVLWAIPTGVLAALYHNTSKDQLLRIVSVLGLSVPGIWLGILFLFIASRYVGWIPPIQWKGITEAPLHNLTMVGVPAVIVAYSTGASIMRMTRAQMLEVLREDYVRTAWAKGLGQKAVLVRHALRNALLPVVTQLGLLLSALATGLVITETIFHIPGLGKTLIDAIAHRDYPVIQGVILVTVVIVLVINLLVDILYAVIDPRIRYS